MNHFIFPPAGIRIPISLHHYQQKAIILLFLKLVFKMEVEVQYYVSFRHTTVIHNI